MKVALRALAPAWNMASRSFCSRTDKTVDFMNIRPTLSPFCNVTSSNHKFSAVRASLEEADETANSSDWFGALKIWQRVLNVDPSNDQALTNSVRFKALINDHSTPESGF